MSYFNKAILANGLNKYADKTCSWVLFGDNEYVEDGEKTTLGFYNKGSADNVAKYTASGKLEGNDSFNLSEFKDINIAAITPAKSVRGEISYDYGSVPGLEVSSMPLFTGALSLNVNSTATVASSTSNNSCFAFPGASTNNFNDSGFTLKYIYLVIWNSVSVGSFPAQFGNIKGIYGQDLEGSKAYWNGTDNINNQSYDLFNDSVELVLFGTNVSENTGLKFNDYNYTTFSVGSLKITLQGLSS